MLLRLWQLIRSVASARTLSAAAIATFGLGIGVTMAVCAATDRLLVRPLPFADPERLVVMREYRDGSRSLGVPAKFVAQVRQADRRRGHAVQ